MADREMEMEPMMLQRKKISRVSMILYGLGDLASQFVWTFTGTYLTVFYTDIVGLAPGVVSIIMLCARLWDGINDPMMGGFAERTKSKIQTVHFVWNTFFSSVYSSHFHCSFWKWGDRYCLGCGDICDIRHALYTCKYSIWSIARGNDRGRE